MTALQSLRRTTTKALPCLAGVILTSPFVAPGLASGGVLRPAGHPPAGDFSDPRTAVARFSGRREGAPGVMAPGVLLRDFASALAGASASALAALPGLTSDVPAASVTTRVDPNSVQSSNCVSRPASSMSMPSCLPTDRTTRRTAWASIHLRQIINRSAAA